MTGNDESYRDKRRYPRHPGPFNAFCPGSAVNDMSVMNLGVGGCFVLVNSGHAVDQTFSLRIDLGDEGVLDVSAMTLYHTINGSAVKFLDLTQSSLGQIQRAVIASQP